LLPLSAGFESNLQLFTLGLHQAKENTAQGIRAFLFENRLNNERPIANVISWTLCGGLCFLIIAPPAAFAARKICSK